MKRRIQGLSSSVKAVKKSSWRLEEDMPDSPGQPAPPDEAEEEEEPKPPPPPSKPVVKKVVSTTSKDPVDSGDELDMMLDAALDEEVESDEVQEAGEAKPPPPPTAESGGINPVVWMDLSVAGKPRGRLHVELYADVVPQTAENFRKLCRGVSVAGRTVGYKGTELHKVLPGRVIEGGEFDCSATGTEFADESFKLTHAKGGLLSMCGAGPDANASRFQVVLRPSPELDNKQVVFGHILSEGPTGNPSDRLHVLHWVEAVGSHKTGTPREALVIEDCGECTTAEAAELVAPRRPEAGSDGDAAEPEPQESRYLRAGLRPAKLVESINRENLPDVLELTGESLDSWEWEVKKAQRSSEGQERSREIEPCLKAIGQVLEEAKYNAGTVQGNAGQNGRKAQCQQLRLKELQETLKKIY